MTFSPTQDQLAEATYRNYISFACAENVGLRQIGLRDTDGNKNVVLKAMEAETTAKDAAANTKSGWFWLSLTAAAVAGYMTGK